ncbi:hypothetical protein [Aquimarina sp. SS2-1]|uniref:hypothetical protein n=1 Tax=Aquimarina besae TaxID=3342247 RepID=UPI0036732DDA
MRTDNNPFYIKGDFNGDTVEDHIILIREKNKTTEGETAFGKIAIIYEGNDPRIDVLGNADDPLGESDYNWVGHFKKVPKGSIIWSNWDEEKQDFITNDPPEKKKHVLKTDAFYIHYLESCGGGFIYFDNGVYKWLQSE